MTDKQDLPAPVEQPTPTLPPDEPVATGLPPKQRRDVLPIICLICVVLLAGGLYWVWHAAVDQPDREIDALNQRIAALDTRMNRAEQAPAPDSGLTARLDALEKRLPKDPGAIDARVSALEQRPVADPQTGARLDSLSGRIEALAGRQQTDQSELSRRIDAEATRLSTVERAAQQVASLADRAGRIARLQAASVALAAGQKLGELPGAPPALARFATVDPPTEAALRLAWPKAAQAAQEVSTPEMDGKPLLDRAWARAQELVTVRQGDHVVVGDASAGILARAQAALYAGDLRGAVAAVNDLSGPPAQAMAAWRADAMALLDARAALAAMADHA